MDKHQLLTFIAAVLTTATAEDHAAVNRNPLFMWYPMPIKMNELHPSMLLRNFPMPSQENQEAMDNFEQLKDKCAQVQGDPAVDTKQTPTYQMGGNYPLYPETMPPYPPYPGGLRYPIGNAPLPYYIFGNNINGNIAQYPYYLNWVQQLLQQQQQPPNYANNQNYGEQVGMPLTNENNTGNNHREEVNHDAPTTVQTEFQTNSGVAATTLNENLTSSAPLGTRPDQQSDTVGTRAFTESPTYRYTTVKSVGHPWLLNESEERSSVRLEAGSLTKTTTEDSKSSGASRGKDQHGKLPKYDENEDEKNYYGTENNREEFTTSSPDSEDDLEAVTNANSKGAKSSANSEITEYTTKFSRILEDDGDEESPMDLGTTVTKDDNTAKQEATLTKENQTKSSLKPGTNENKKTPLDPETANTEDYTESSTDLEPPVTWASEDHKEPLTTPEDHEYPTDEDDDETSSTNAYPSLNSKDKTKQYPEEKTSIDSETGDSKEKPSQNLTTIFRENSTDEKIPEAKDDNRDDEGDHTKSISIQEEEYYTEPEEPAEVVDNNHESTTAREETTAKDDTGLQSPQTELKDKAECLANLSTEETHTEKHKKANAYHDDKSKSQPNDPEVGMDETKDHLHETETTTFSYLTDQPKRDTKTTTITNKIYKTGKDTSKTVHGIKINKDIYPTLPALIEKYLTLTASENKSNTDLHNKNNSESKVSDRNGNCTCLYEVIQQLLMELTREKQAHSLKSLRFVSD